MTGFDVVGSGSPAAQQPQSKPVRSMPFLRPVDEHPQRAALALCAALLPQYGDIPGADERTVRRAEEVVHQFAPSAVRPWRAAQRLLDVAAVTSTGRPFHKLDADRQEQLLRRWERHPVYSKPLALLSLLYKMVHFDQPHVYRALGGRPKPPVRLDQPRWLQQVHTADEYEGKDDLDCEVVIVGTGAGGAVVGRELAERGYAVVFVEEGKLHRRDAFDGSSVRAHQRFYRAAFSVGNAVMPIFMGRLVGGSTAINGGTCFRTPSWVLDRWCEQMGTDDFAPAAMRRYFEKVEATLQVAAPPRAQVGPIQDIFTRGCETLGWSHGPIRRNAPACESSGFCDFGCPSAARHSTDISYVPGALEQGAMLFTELKAERVLIANGRAVGIAATSSTGRPMRIHARAVILAGGAVPTPLMLMRQGIATSSGQVGRNLTVHPSSGLSALFDEPVNGFNYIPQGYASEHFLRQGMLLLAAQPDHNIAPVLFPFAGQRLMQAMQDLPHIASFGLLVRDSAPSGRIHFQAGGLPAIHYSLSREDVALLHEGTLHLIEMAQAAGAKKFFPSIASCPVVHTGRELERFRKAKIKPADVLLTSYHPLGTCKMGHDPASSVVGLDHQTHDVPRLFVVDGSTVPGPLGVNPQLTIMAMATRAAERIAAVLG